jgi:hypothetical protein
VNPALTTAIQKAADTLTAAAMDASHAGANVRAQTPRRLWEADSFLEWMDYADQVSAALYHRERCVADEDNAERIVAEAARNSLLTARAALAAVADLAIRCVVEAKT